MACQADAAGDPSNSNLVENVTNLYKKMRDIEEDIIKEL